MALSPVTFPATAACPVGWAYGPHVVAQAPAMAASRCLAGEKPSPLSLSL